MSARGTRAQSLMTSSTALVVIGLTVLAAMLRFWRLGHQGFWFDEGNTALLVQFSPGKMLGLIPQTESTPPLYYCVAWVWAKVFGHSEVPLRALSALIGVAVVPVAYAAGAKLISRRAGFVACALTACNPLLIWYSQEARSYEMLVLLSSASLLSFAYAREHPTPRRLAAWVVMAALALATHYYSVLVIVPEAAWLLRQGLRRRGVQVAVGIVAAFGLALIPLALSQNHRGLTSWIGKVPVGRRLAQVWPQFALGFGSPAWQVLKWVALAAAVTGLALLMARPDGRARRGAFLAAGLGLAGLIINLLLIAGGADDLITRNLLALWMPVTLAVAGGLGAPRTRLIGLAATAVLCACGIVAVVGVATDRNLERPDWRVVARTIGPAPSGGAATGAGRALLVQHYRDLLPLSLYLHGLKWINKGTSATVSELDIVSFTSPRSHGFCWWGAACNLWPSRMQAAYHIPGFRPVWRRQELQFTILHMVASHPVTLTWPLVSRALHTTRISEDELLVQR